MINIGKMDCVTIKCYNVFDASFASNSSSLRNGKYVKINIAKDISLMSLNETRAQFQMSASL